MTRMLLFAGALALVACTPAEKSSAPSGSDPAAAAPATAPAAQPAPEKPAAPAAGTGSNVGDRIPAFEATLVDATGAEQGTFDSHAVDSPVAYVFLGTQCGSTRMYLERVRAIEASYSEKGVEFVYVYPNKTDASEAKRSFHGEHQLAGPLIDDQNARIAKLLGASKTSEVVLTNREGTIVYRGAIDDSKDPSRVTRKHLAMAIDETLAGKQVGTPKTDVDA
jgi:peroxiredoxin